MPLPPKEMYSFCEAAEMLKVSVQTIEDYLLTGKLTTSFYLRNTTMGKFTPVLNPDASYSDDDPYIWDVDYDYHGDSDLFTKITGTFDLVYKNFAWDQNWQTTVPKGFNLSLGWPHEYEGFYGLADPYVLKRDDLFITINELERFSAEHGLMIEIPSVQNRQEHSIPASSGTIIQCQQKEVKNYVDSDDMINPKRETTLLTVIAALLEVISGEFVNKEVTRHPSIKDQSDLIDKIAELETPGLSKRNLQKIFPEAKEAKKRR